MVPAETLNFWLALGMLATQVTGGALLIMFIFQKKTSLYEELSSFLQKWGLLLGLALAFSGTLLSLYYSEGLGFPPCPLCWWQRIFLYPQVILFALALWKRLPGQGGRDIADYSIALSVVGLGFALYHHALQVLPSGSLPCPAEGVVSCAQRFVFEFGYITFPLMAATLFASLIILMLFVRPVREPR